jgi:Glycosyl hydrolases family 35
MRLHPLRSQLSRRAVLGGSALAAAALATRPALALAATAEPAIPRGGAGLAAGRAGHPVSFDRYSLLIDGRRLFVWSGEFHPFRLPSPALWLDILQKMKANGYNAVCMYFSWSYHSPPRAATTSRGSATWTWCCGRRPTPGCTSWPGRARTSTPK